MKTLYVLRHAKSDWGDAGLDDHARPLARRGRRACEALARFFGTLPPPQLAWCSSALRTRETFERTLDGWTQPPRLEVRDALYLASPEGWLDALAGTEASLERVLLVGHNPGLHRLTLELAGRAVGDAGERVRAKFPTGAFAVLELDADAWDLSAGSGTLARFVTPRELARNEG